MLWTNIETYIYIDQRNHIIQKYIRVHPMLTVWCLMARISVGDLLLLCFYQLYTKRFCHLPQWLQVSQGNNLCQKFLYSINPIILHLSYKIWKSVLMTPSNYTVMIWKSSWCINLKPPHRYLCKYTSNISLSRSVFIVVGFLFNTVILNWNP